MIRLVVTADDFGQAVTVNGAVERAHRDGILTAASLMVAGPAAADAVARAKIMPSLGVGLHLVMVEARPMLSPDAVPDLVGGDGLFRTDMARLGLDIAVRPRVRAQLRAEIAAQFGAFADTGLPFDHVNAHKHFHVHPVIAGMVLAEAERHGVRAIRAPVERGRPRGMDWFAAPFARSLRDRARRRGMVVPDQVYGLAASGRMDADTIRAAIADLPSGLSELYSHPALSDDFPGHGPGYRHRDELAGLIDPAVDAALVARGALRGNFATFAGGRTLSARAHALILAATVIGLAVAMWAFAATGFAGIVHVVARMGGGGLLLYCAYSACVFVILGAAWLAAAPGEAAGKLGLFAWGRAVREAVADLLPFSQLGGIVVGARTIANGGVATPRVYASLIVDMTTELASQLAFTLFGVATVVSLLTAGPDADRLKPLLLAGVAVLAGIVVALFGAQRLLLRIAARLAQQVLPGSAATIEAIGGELTRIHAHRGRVALALTLNLAAWIASAGGAWIVLRLMDVALPLSTVLAIEALIFTLRSVAFAIPGGIGVQEAAYALVGPALGLPPEAALALALAKRARDVALGIPTLLLWQATQARALVRG